MATVIRFPAAGPRSKLFEPPVVTARSPDGEREQVRLEISAATIQKIVQAGLKVPLFQAWAHLVGEMPPVNNVFKLRAEHPEARIRTIAQASTIFRGVRRPCGLNGTGDDVYIYVVETPETVCWRSDMACVVGISPCPPSTVLTVYVRRSGTLQPQDPSVWGIISKWEFVGASPEQPHLPIDFDNRYDEQLWPR